MSSDLESDVLPLHQYPKRSPSRTRTSTYRVRVCRACRLHQRGSSSGNRNRTCVGEIQSLVGEPAHHPRSLDAVTGIAPAYIRFADGHLTAQPHRSGERRRSRTPAGFPTPGFQDQCPTTRASLSGWFRQIERLLSTLLPTALLGQ